MNAKTIVKGFIALAMAVLMQACGGAAREPDPQRDALAAAIAEKITSDAQLSSNANAQATAQATANTQATAQATDVQVTFSAFAKADSTTFGQEFDHRCKVFDLKLEQDTKLYNEYRAKKMEVNAEKKQKAIASDKRIIAGLAEIGAAIAATRDEVAYYDYTFSGRAKTSGGDVVFENYWASITPDGKVLCFQPEQKGLHNALGRVLPGYEALVTE